MPLLSTADQERLRQDFRACTRAVRLLFFSQTLECDQCPRARAILAELPPLSDRVSIEEVNFLLEPERAARYRIDRVPAIALLGVDDEGRDVDSRIRFLGTPSGHEFISLVRAILLVGGAPSTLSAVNRERLAAVTRPITLRVFTTPSCVYCPAAVTLAHEMAWHSPHITSFAVETTEYPDLARRYRVTGVPKTVVDDRIEILGATPQDEFIAQALELPLPDDRPIGEEPAR